MSQEPYSTKEPVSIDVNYVESSFSRVIHVDGAWGGLAPQGNIHMAIYSEHNTSPQQVTYTFVSGETKEKVEMSVGKGRFTREIEANLIMTPDVARAIRDWIDDKLKVFRQSQSASLSNPRVE